MYVITTTFFQGRQISYFGAQFFIISKPLNNCDVACNSCKHITHYRSDKLHSSSFVVKIMAANQFDGQCYFNILFFNKVPHVAEQIFFLLDYESFKACLEVNGKWRELLTSERYIKKGKFVFRLDILEDEKNLLIAIDEDNTYDAKILLASGMVDVNCSRDDYGNPTGLQVAAMKGHKEMARILIGNGAELNVADKRGETPLHWAAQGGHKEVGRLLIENRADVNVADEYGRTPLHEAIKNDKKEVARLLIESGAEVNMADKDGETPLHKGAIRGHQEVAQFLIENGADVNVADEDGETPLHWAADKAHKKVALLLIENGADVNVVDKLGITPLHWAAKRGHKEVAQLLIENGADKYMADNERNTPRQFL